MPISFSFRRLSDNKAMNLDDIDELICKELEIPVQKDDYSSMFQLITTIGDQMGKDWDEKKFQEILKIIKTTSEKNIKMIRRFLYEEYKYTSWRSFK